MIKAFALDIDGVFTDGSILCTTDGDLLRVYDAKDGFAIRMAVMNGYPVGIITGGSSESIRKRMRASGIPPEDVYLHCRDKMEQFRDFCEKHGLKPEEVMYFGDDVPDIEVLQAAGCAPGRRLRRVPVRRGRRSEGGGGHHLHQARRQGMHPGSHRTNPEGPREMGLRHRNVQEDILSGWT